ncbi:MAG TPA: hypothetical protein PLM14_00730 [Candidatus Hydrogenedentes bacterium]|nr:hypothetical protein [Candidatus Hydrogenedentota bacterium]
MDTAKRRALCAVLVGVLLAGGNVPAWCDRPVTHVPFVYEIDYEDGQARKGSFKEHFETFAPELFHPGPDLRYFGRFGFGSGVPLERSMSFEAYAEETAAYIRFLHDKGVRWVTPYLCNQTLTGNEVTRSGAWEVLDRWEEFEPLGIGPKPASLLDWLQREPDGNLHYNYKRKCFLERGLGDEYIRFAPCPSHPGWRQFCANEARLAAQVGCDGLFIDNCILHCYCEHCEAGFQKYLRQKYTSEELQRDFGAERYEDVRLYSSGDLRVWAQSFEAFIPWLEKRYPPQERLVHFDTTGALDAEHVANAGGGMLVGEASAFISEQVLAPGIRPTFEALRLANPALQTPEGRLRWFETQKFWAYSNGQMLAQMRDAGRTVKPDFFLVPNWGTLQRVNAAAGRAEDGKDFELMRAGADWWMFEEGNTTGLVAPGVVVEYDAELRLAFAHGLRAMLLPYKLDGADVTAVALAETAASGGSVFVGMRQDAPIQARYQSFFREFGDLFDGYTSGARIGLVHLFDQLFYLNIEHVRQVHALNRALADMQIPFDHVVEKDLTADRLNEYDVVIFPHTVFLSDKDVDAIGTYVAGGGTLAAIGEVGTRDLACKPRTGVPPATHRYPTLNSVLTQDGIYLEPALQSVETVELGEAAASRYLKLAEFDRVLWFKRYQETGVLGELLDSALGADAHILDPVAGSGMRVFVYEKRLGGKTRVVVHLVNKNVPLDRPVEERRLARVRNLKVNLPVRGSGGISELEVHAPEDTAPRVVSADYARGQVALDEVGAYTLLTYLCDTESN